MIISPFTVVVALLVMACFAYFGLQIIRKFALQIAMEEHENLVAMDNENEANRQRQEKIAEEAEARAKQKIKAADIRQV